LDSSEFLYKPQWKVQLDAWEMDDALCRRFSVCIACPRGMRIALAQAHPDQFLMHLVRWNQIGNSRYPISTNAI
jgi:hypothetical protein